ncbi:MAG: DUF1566 domain-containing protein [Desulfotignum sp.]
MGRFCIKEEVVVDEHTGLMWPKDAGLLEFPMTWEEALEQIRAFNESGLYGYHDWKLPNRKELFSLMSHDEINPSLPKGHPFTQVFHGYFWTATTCARLPDQAWYVHLGGARVFKGMKLGSYMVWPVRIAQAYDLRVGQTGQKTCFNARGNRIDCHGSGQDGEFQSGVAYPDRRFTPDGDVVHDTGNGLTWLKNAGINNPPLDWKSAKDLVSRMNKDQAYGYNDWRVPEIRELESLTDMDHHSPALPADHPFTDVQAFYWSADTSRYDTAYAWVLYMVDGAVGVGYKPLPEFFLWPVRGPCTGMGAGDETDSR